MDITASGREATEVADDVVAIVQRPGTLGRSNSVLVFDQDAAMVIDTMLFPALAEGIWDELRRHGAKPLTVVNTHPHVDHVGGNAAFPGTPLLALPATVAMTTQLARDTSFLPRLFPHFADRVDHLEILPPTSPDVWDLPRGALPLALGPAHSPGDLAIWLPEQETLVTGDLCFNMITPLALPGHANLGGWIAALEELIALRPRVVVPGHGPVGTAATLEVVRGYLTDLVETAARVVAGDLDQAAATAHLQNGPVSEWAEPERTAMNLALAVTEAAGKATEQRQVAPLLATPEENS